MKIGSLFSGIGGLELGLELAGVGHTVWRVEQDEFCLGVLARRWPHAARFSDVRSVGAANLPPVDLICGGFPCQDVSGAGKGAGLSGARSGLWYEFARVVSELRPGWVVVENVASGAKRWVDAVVRGLQDLGYQCLPLPLTANNVGAPHRRGRVLILARLMGAPPAPLGQPAADPFAGWDRLDVPGVARGKSTPLDRARLKALGNAVVPQCAEVAGHLITGLSSNPHVRRAAEVLLEEAAAAQVVGEAWDGRAARRYRRRVLARLPETEVLLPTPSASSYGSSGNGDPHDGRGQYAHAGTPSLDTLARRDLLPTPTAWGREVASACEDRTRKAHPGVSLTDVVVHDRSVHGEQHGGREPGAGRLNPDFVEWMMGFATGWTAL